jgi:hypothetical protein
MVAWGLFYADTFEHGSQTIDQCPLGVVSLEKVFWG